MPAPEFASWSVDSRTLYYTAFDHVGKSSIWSVPVDGGEPSLRVRFDDPTRSAGRREFATDGRNFFFTLGLRESDIWVMQLETR
jgi:Tol biopolymer transport system component